MSQQEFWDPMSQQEFGIFKNKKILILSTIKSLTVDNLMFMLLSFSWNFVKL